MIVTDLGTPGFERVVRCHDETSGFLAFVAVHDTTLGPAVGGCRSYRYAGEEEARRDAEMLAMAMTYKSAMAGVPLGGGKMVVALPAPGRKPEGFHRLVAEAVDCLNGRYLVAEDMGTGREDIAEIAKYTKNVVYNPAMGDPSCATAHGVVLSIIEAVRLYSPTDIRFNDTLTVAIQGVGAVGSKVAEILATLGAKVYASDVDTSKTKRLATEGIAEIVEPSRITATHADVFCPCGKGGTVTELVAASLPVNVVCGAANNQIATRAAEETLHRRGILYAPDFVVNAGGIVHAWMEILGRTDPWASAARIIGIPDRLRQVVTLAKDKGELHSEVAGRMARAIIENARGLRSPAVSRGRLL